VTLSLIIAAMIWFMISMRESYSVVQDVDTRVVNVPSDEALVDYPPSSVQVQLEGQGWQLLKMYTRPQPILLNAASDRVDLLRAASESFPSEITAQSVSPPQIELLLEPLEKKKVPIELQAELETSPPYDLLRNARVEPDSVEISGARSLIEGIDSWPTAHFSRDDINASFTEPLSLANLHGGLVALSPSTTLLIVAVTEFTEDERDIEVRVTGAPSADQRVRLIPDRVTVRYTVSLQEFERAKATDSLYATVAYTDILADTTGRIEPRIHLPENLSIRGLTVETPRLQYYLILD
jgi:YbbR domain-containing protein